jgi:transposase-like protein
MTEESENISEEISKEINEKISENISDKVNDGILTIEKREGRRKCPKCNNENKFMIKESTDKGNIILAYPKVYGKKYKCGQCGIEWREK